MAPLVPPPDPSPPPVRQPRVLSRGKRSDALNEREASPGALSKQTERQPRRVQDENMHNHHFPNHQDVRPSKVSKVFSFEESMEEAGLNPISPRPISPARRHKKTSQEGVAMVVIPLSDTPTILRNKQFRKDGGGGSDSRRSSFGLRGRRASSLLDNGQVGMLGFFLF